MNDWRERAETGRWSTGATLVWQIAVSEARHQGYSQVEPLHLLIGICSIGKALDPGAGRSLEMPKDAAASARAEWDLLSRVFANCGINETNLRRASRAALANDNRAITAGQEIAPSPVTLDILISAAQMAQARNEKSISSPYLLASLLEFPSSPVPQFLAGCRENVENLLAAIQTALLSSGGPPIGNAPDLEVTRTIAINTPAVSAAPGPTHDMRERLAFLYELPLQFAQQASSSEALPNLVVERLLALIPGAARGALLLRDPKSGQLLLKAHLPPGRPAVSLTLAQRAIDQGEAILWRQGEDISKSIEELRTRYGMYAPLVWADQVLGVLCVDNPRCEQPFHDDDLRLLLAVARYAAMSIANRKLQEEAQQNAAMLARLLTNFSPNLRKILLERARHGKLRLGGQKSEVTILCSDIRGFTRLAAAMDAAEIVDLLNDYLSKLTDAVFRFRGTVDKYIGDAILAVFGSPEPDADQHGNALRAAVEMQAAMKAINAERSRRGLVTCEIGIGIHCGEVLHGFIGSSDRLEFTVIGDAVNKTSRYCDCAQAGEILISPSLYEHTWRILQADSVSISAKHGEQFAAYRLGSLIGI